MNTRTLVAGALIAAFACKGAHPGEVAERQEPAPDVARSEDSSADQQTPSVQLPALCLLAGADAVEREDTFTLIVFDYFGQTDDCRTRSLWSAMSSIQSNDWIDYLINYSHALFGCGLWFEPLPGGVEAFGLANTDSVGIPSPTLGTDDAARLIDLYLASCTNALAVTSDQLLELRGRLEAAAKPHIDPSSSTRLSDCP